jgi:hypothetical protein
VSLNPRLRGYSERSRVTFGDQTLFIFTFAVGTATVAAIALSPLYAPRLRVLSSSRVGMALVGTSILLGAFAFATSGGLVAPKDELFLCLFALLLLGTLLILADGPDERDDHGGDGDDSDGDPPWWPEFEAGFSSYTRQPRSPVATR